MLITLCSMAFAADLKVNMSVPERGPLELTFHDVTPGALVTVAAPPLADRIVLEATQDTDGVHNVTVEFVNVKRAWFGRVRQEKVWHHVLKVPPDTVATFSMTRPAKVPGSDPVTYRDLDFEIDARIEEAPAVQ